MSEAKTVKSKIEVDEHEEFEGVLVNRITTTMNLAQEINRLFKPIFHDYEGCTILPNQFGAFQLTLFFKDKGKADSNKIKNVTTIVKQVAKDDLKARISNFNKRNSRASVYELTEECKEALSEFVGPMNKDKKINWKEFVVESTDRAFNGGLNIYTKVINVDLNRILRKIYTGETDSYFDYQIVMLRPASAVQGGSANNFLVNIVQLDTKKVRKLYEEMGMIPAQGTFIVRD